MTVKILVDVDVLEELLEGYGDDCAGSRPLGDGRIAASLISDQRDDLAAQILRARCAAAGR